MATTDAERFMTIAIAEARKALGHTSPNPAVGAVIVRRGKIVGAGFHASAGTAHAEVVALAAAGAAAKGADLYCTLEPCNHTGRTGPCTEAVIAAGIERVIVGAVDPNPLVRGKGLRRLRRAGVEVRQGLLAQACAALNEGYNFSVVRERPLVVLKAAMSVDGRIATRAGHSQWITGAEARADGRQLRVALDAILVGVGTARADDPRLTARVEGARDPVRVVMDSALRIPRSSKLVTTARQTPTIIATTRAAPAAKRRALEAAGVEVVPVRKRRDGRCDPQAVLAHLHDRGLRSVLVEGGPSIHGAFVDAGLVDKAVLYIAPLLIGGEAPAAVGGKGARRLEDALRLWRTTVDRIGPDLRLTGYVDAR